MLTRPSPTSRGLGRFVSFRMGRWWKLTAAGPRARACPLRRLGGGRGGGGCFGSKQTHTRPTNRGAAVPPASAFGSKQTHTCPTSRGPPPAFAWRSRARTLENGVFARGARRRVCGGRGRLRVERMGELGDWRVWGFGNLGIRSLSWGQGSVSPRAAMLAPQAARAAAENKPLVRLVRKYASAHRRPPFPVPAIHPCCRPPRRRRGHGGFPARPIFRAAHPRCPPTPPFAPLCAFAPSHRIQFNVSLHIFPPVVL